MTAHVIIYGAPRTKKNHGAIFRPFRRGGGRGRPRVMPSKQWLAWVRDCEVMILFGPVGAIDTPVSCRAMFYRDAERGDAIGYYQGLADLLEHKKLIVNDVLIRDWDGSRLLKDASAPRVEIWLEPVT